MKNLITFFCLFVYNYGNSQSETPFYTFIQSGYKFGTTFSTIPNYLEERLGGGYTGTIGLGKMIHKNIGLEISNTYSSSPSRTYSDKTFQSESFHSVGSIVIQAPVSHFIMYVKAGIVIGWYHQTDVYGHIQTYEMNNSYRSQIMRGFNGSLGMLYPISKKINIMIEAEEVGIQGQVASNNPSTNHPLIDVYPVTYVDDISTVSGIGFGKNFPMSYSVIGFNLGLQYKF